MASKPIVGKKVDRLYSIPGKVPNPVNMPNYCYFKDRCEMALPCCMVNTPARSACPPRTRSAATATMKIIERRVSDDGTGRKRKKAGLYPRHL